MTPDELFQNYVADTLDEAGTAELGALLQDPEFAAQFAQNLIATGKFVQVGDELQRVAEPPPAPHPHLVTGKVAGAGLPPSLQPHPPAGLVTPAPAPPPPPAPAPVAVQDPYAQPGAVVSTHPEVMPGEPPHVQPVLKSAQQKSMVVPLVITIVLVAGIAAALLIGLNQDDVVPDQPDPVIARVDSVDGSLYLTRGTEHKEAPAGTDILKGDTLSVRIGSARIAFANEATFLHLGTGCDITFEDPVRGKQLRLTLGEVTVEAAPQPIGKPLVVRTGNASATAVKTKFLVRSAPKATLVDVSEGVVKVERTSDGRQVEVGKGAYTSVGEDGPLTAWEFHTAVNLNGEGVEINGNTWLSQADAGSKGLVVDALGKSVIKRQAQHEPKGFVASGAVRKVIMTSVDAKNSKLSLKLPVENGRYQVFLWIMEEQGDKVRSLRLNVEEKLVEEGLGKDQMLGEWNRFGPYDALVEDGAIDFLLSPDGKFANKDAHAAGFSLFKGLGGIDPPENRGDEPADGDEAPDPPSEEEEKDEAPADGDAEPAGEGDPE